MAGNVVSVTVLCERRSESTEKIGRWLDENGLRADLVPLRTWLEGANHNDPDVVVIIFDDYEPQTIDCIDDLGIPLVLINPPLHSPTKTRHELPWPCSAEAFLESVSEATRTSIPRPISVSGTCISEEFWRLNIYGTSPTFRGTLESVQRFAHCLATILIEGETGTGKELVARALHYFGPRKGKPFIPVNCAALPDSLLENELFGHVKGAYTGAGDSCAGLVEQAKGGTLFFDEIDSLTAKAQATLLRFLQDQKYRPLGGAGFKQGEAAVICATNANLREQVDRGEFRKDLYYRLNTITIPMPPLRKRTEDITLLARLFLRRLCEQYDQAPRAFHPDSLTWLEQQQWPGNVRELENTIHRHFLLSDARIIRIDHLHRSDAGEAPSVRLPENLTRSGYDDIRGKILREFERKYLHQLMRLTLGNVSRAAQLAGKERRTIGRLLKKHHIDRTEYLQRQ